MDKSIQKAIGYNLGSTFFAMSALLTRNIQANDLDLTHRQAKFLLFLGFNEGKKQQELAQVMKRDKPSITKMIDLLEKKGLVERRQDKDDRRNKLVYLTPAGTKIRSELIPVISQTMNQATSNLSKGEHDKLIELLIRVRENIENQLDDSFPFANDML